MPRGRPIDEAWLRERYPRMTDVNELLDDHEAEFGWRPAKTSLYTKANRMGLRKDPVTGRGDRAERTIRWSKEPEMEAWMLKHDKGQRMDRLQAEWRGRWGFGISRAQVNIFRATHGTQTRRARCGGRPRVPVGTERESKDGYVVVKVAEEPTVPMSKDNWRLKHVWVWEQEHGPLPSGHVVYFADGDRRNFDPSNLVAVPRTLVGQVNLLGGEGMGWHDRESLETVVALARIRVERNRIERAMPRTCAVCGQTFTNEGRAAANSRTCPECVAAGHKPTYDGRATRTYDHDEMRRLHAEGLTEAEIARRVGCAVATVYYALGKGRRK